MKSRLLMYGMALAAASISQAAYKPIAIQSSSYNADVIVESNATPSLTISTTASIDQGTNNYNATLEEVGRDLANPTYGLPHAGTTVVSHDNANYSFLMPPSYAAPNGILIDSFVTTGTFTPITAQAYTTLSFLCLGGNGGDTMNATVHHQDGTTETHQFSSADWFGNPTGIAIQMGGRITQVYNLNSEVDGGTGGNPQVYHREITLTDTASAVTNIVLTYVSGNGGSHSDVMAVSGALTSGNGTTVSPIPVTGYDYDFVVEDTAPQPGRVLSQTMSNGTNLWATTQSLDSEDNTGNSWYEQGYNINNDASGSLNNPLDNLTGTGLPHPGGFITNAAQDHVFQTAPDYTVNNAVYIDDQDAFTNATITLAGIPTAYSGLSLLASAGNGPVVVNYVITYQGGTKQSGVLSIADWFDSGNPTFVANGRVAVDTAFFANVNSGFPILHQNDIVLTDTADPVVSIYLENTNGVTEGFTSGRFSILAVSGNVGALPPVPTQQPASVNLYNGSSVTFTSTATANAPITYQWQKGTNGVYANLSNGGNISGVFTTILSISPAGFTDQADYRLVFTDSASSVASSAATLGVFSTLLDVTQPGDPVTGVNVNMFGDSALGDAIDDSNNDKFGANPVDSSLAPGLTVSPAVGRTVVSALRLYTGADSTDRDPTSYKLEGSLNGGSTYTLISSNSIVLPSGRNPLIGATYNPLTMFVTEVHFANANAYTTYKLTFPTRNGGTSDAVQFDQLELLGTNAPGVYFSTQPVDAKAYGFPTSLGVNSASFTGVAAGSTPTPTVSWEKGNNGVYVSLADGGNISGSQTTTLNINPTTFADSADYIAVADSSGSFVTSSIAHLYTYSTNVDVTQPTDPITGFGDTSIIHGAATNAANAIDDTFTEWVSGGSGPNNSGGAAGIPPFVGPVGLIVTPAAGSTVLSGLRVYPGQDAANSDPSGFVLEGSSDGGATYAPIASGSLSLPPDRTTIAMVVDPIQAPVQEVRFSNTKGYTTYRLTFPSVRDPNSIPSFLEVGDVELLGVPGVGVAQPVISSTTLSGGNLHFSITGGTPSGTYSVLTNANLMVPLASWGTAASGTLDGSGSASVSLPVSPSNPRLFYRIKTP